MRQLAFARTTRALHRLHAQWPEYEDYAQKPMAVRRQGIMQPVQ
jgi:hypothetical protein